MHDSGALQSLVGDRFVSTEWDGQLSSRDQFLADIRDPKFKPSIMSVQDLKVEFYGDTASLLAFITPRVSITESPTSTRPFHRYMDSPECRLEVRRQSRQPDSEMSVS